jgi:hypothetical protein
MLRGTIITNKVRPSHPANFLPTVLSLSTSQDQMHEVVLAGMRAPSSSTLQGHFVLVYLRYSSPH